MSWNDNGKNGSRDPWGNKNDAPDIDEAIKKFKSLIPKFQNLIKKRNTSEDTDIKLEFRVGLNSGDVVVENENLLGDGVNIAARL